MKKNVLTAIASLMLLSSCQQDSIINEVQTHRLNRPQQILMYVQSYIMKITEM
ncbi:MAG: hypothetical protein E6772_13340 [Dysgonomonas sp.]|nr:hypothetical protein [Dysgonomonas sp.]